MKKKAKLFCAKRDGILPAILPLFEFVKQGIKFVFKEIR